MSDTAVPGRRIVLCHLESLVCLPAINLLFEDLGDEIVAVVLSRRFSGRHGGLLTQLARSVRRSGWRLTLWLGFDIVAAQILSAVAPWVTSVLRRGPELQSVRSLAARYGARVIESSDVNGPELLDVMRAAEVDVVIVLNFDQILQPRFIAVAKRGVINVHPSLLPAFRGPCPVFWALLEGHDGLGVTVHLIEDAEIDAGAHLRQKPVSLDVGPSVAEITTVLFHHGAALVRSALGQGEIAAPPPRPAATTGSYRSFPARRDVARGFRRGIRLWRARHVARLIAAATGLSATGTWSRRP